MVTVSNPVVLVTFVFTVIFVTACISPPPAPIDGRTPPPSQKINVHYVSKGDTLFSVAWTYEKNVHKLARANGLQQPYTIYQGQRLTLDTSRLPAIQANQNKARARPSSADKSGSRAAQPAASKTKPSQPKTTRSPVASKPKQGSTGSNSKTTAKLPSKWHWQWPVPGSISRQYNAAALFKGIDLRVAPGQSVAAAASGIVVYAGSGLRGYGKMIIIKHSEVYLSAYAHNRAILVKEGQVVKGGQKISEAGGDPANRRRLYFEIRKDGKPQDPRLYLPKK